MNERLISSVNGTRPSHIEMYLGLEVERTGLRGCFLIGELEGTRGCSYFDCFGDIGCDGNFSESNCRLVYKIVEKVEHWNKARLPGGSINNRQAKSRLGKLVVGEGLVVLTTLNSLGIPSEQNRTVDCMLLKPMAKRNLVPLSRSISWSSI
ncbi:hypothetical protein TNCV_480731 [Trichonephila clavipes]|nr:hypothetical protein TNCV_480731 [Trichonephila clavipes]